MVFEFHDVFSDNLLGLAPKKEFYFSIELAIKITPISKALYRMASVELLELKNQLQDF